MQKTIIMRRVSIPIRAKMKRTMGEILPAAASQGFSQMTVPKQSGAAIQKVLHIPGQLCRLHMNRIIKNTLRITAMERMI